GGGGGGGWGGVGGGGVVGRGRGRLGGGRRERVRGRRPDRAAAAGDDGDLAGERLLRRGAELGLLERPIFHVEHLGFRDRLEATDRFGIGDDLDRALREIGGDFGVLFRTSEAEQAQARDERDA